LWSVIGFSPVEAVAHVVNGHVVSLDLGPASLGHIRLPVFRLGRPDGEPPAENAAEKNSQGQHLENEWPQAKKNDEEEKSGQNCRHPVGQAERGIEPNSSKDPEDTNQTNDNQTSFADPKTNPSNEWISFRPNITCGVEKD